MAVVAIEGAMSPDRWQSLFVYVRDEEDGECPGDGRVMTANHAAQIVDVLTEDAGSMTAGRPPEGFVPLWLVEIQVSDTHRTTSRYVCSYRKRPGCPNAAAEYMMGVYAAVKRVLRGAKNGKKGKSK